MRLSPHELVILHAVGKTYGQRPSGLLGISDQLAALNFDVAVMLAGLQQETQKHPTGPGIPARLGKYGSLQELVGLQR